MVYRFKKNINNQNLVRRFNLLPSSKLKINEKKAILYIFGFWLIFYSCEQDVTLDFDNVPKLCLNCVLNPDSVVSASLTLSHSLDNSGSFEAVDNGTLTLYEGDELFGILEGKGNGSYKLNRKPAEGKEYKIVAEAKGYTTVSASTTIPDFPVIEYSKIFTGHPSYDSTLAVFDLNVQIKDKSGKDNYWVYENWVVSGRKYGGVSREINAPFLDDFNKTIDTEARYGFTLFLGVRLSDEGYDGQPMNFIMPDFVEGTEYRYTEAVYFLNADEHYDKYLKTSILNRMKETSDLPFFEPVQMYSNIENGYGIFGACAITSVNMKTPTHEK